MSLQFSNTAATGQPGMMQLIERRCGFQPGDITGDTELMQYFTGEVNLAVSQMLGKFFPQDGTWQIDDTNHTKHPFIYTTLTAGKRDYTFDTDEQGNIIVDVFRVMVADQSGVFHDVIPVDQMRANSSIEDTTNFIDGRNTAGRPTSYDKTGRTIFFDLVPNYTVSKGIKMFIDREAIQYTVNDTVKVLGFAHLYHEYPVLVVSYKYACDKGLKNKDDLEKQMLRMEVDMTRKESSKEKDKRSGFRAAVERND